MNSNILDKTTCTVIGAMQYSVNGRDVRAFLTEELRKHGITVYDHYRKPFVDSVDEDESVHAQLREWLKEEKYDEIASKRNIRSFDLKLVDISDFVIFVFDPDVPTCGSWEEFFLANRAKRPIFFVNIKGKQRTPLWVFWTIPHKYIYSSLADVLKTIGDIDSGKHPIDSERWKLLKKEFR